MSVDLSRLTLIGWSLHDDNYARDMLLKYRYKLRTHDYYFAQAKEKNFRNELSLFPNRQSATEFAFNSRINKSNANKKDKRNSTYVVAIYC